MHMLCVFILIKLYNIDYIISYWMFIFLPTVSVVFFLEYTVMLLLITSVKVRSTRTYMCEISSILLKFCARFWQISSKMFVIPPQISSNLNFQHMKRVVTLIYPTSNNLNGIFQVTWMSPEIIESSGNFSLKWFQVSHKDKVIFFRI